MDGGAETSPALSTKQVQMARELGLNPDKLGKIDNHKPGTVEKPASAVYRAHLFSSGFKREETGNGQSR